jgi:phosphoribosylamine--glycine ligase
VIGPSQRGAELESSKKRGRRFCSDHGIRTPRSREFDDPAQATAYVRKLPYSVVVKEDGLTDCGDGVHVCSSPAEAENAIAAIARRMGSSFSVLVEERHAGIDISLLALTDGRSYVMFPAALDYKRCADGDRGKNCDGMGSLAPHPLADVDLYSQATAIFDKVMAGLAAEQIRYNGFIFVGAMLTEDGLVVLELNARFGDSEAQVVLPSLRSNFTNLCRAVLQGRLRDTQVDFDGLVRCCVIATQGNVAPNDPNSKPGWPFGPYEVGLPIAGIENIDPTKAVVFLAGTAIDESGRYVTSRGRVLHVVGFGETVNAAVSNAYTQIQRISFAGIRYRTDIGRVAPHAPPRRRAAYPAGSVTAKAQKLKDRTFGSSRSESGAVPAGDINAV